MTKISEMKKMTMICMAALLVMAMSCKKEKVENTAVGAGFRATLEAHAGDSKTHLDGLSVKWDLGDAVTVVNANDVAKTFVISAIHDDYSDLVPAEGEGVTFFDAKSASELMRGTLLCIRQAYMSEVLWRYNYLQIACLLILLSLTSFFLSSSERDL